MLMEKVYSEGRQYFDDLIEAIERATTSIDLEIYIFGDDELGSEVLQALRRAGQRGVRVRLIVDGVGSRDWVFKHYRDKSYPGIELRVFRPLPWPFSKFYLPMVFDILSTIQLLWYVNRRTHKKLILIDDRIIFLGSFNIFNEALLWKELGVQISEIDVSEVKASFLHSWNIAKAFPKFPNRAEKKKLYMEYKNSRKIWTNFKLADRRGNHTRLESMILQAGTRVWLSQAYFLPTIGILRALLKAAENGIDVRLVQSRDSDVMLVRWATIYYYRKLILAGVKIYEYLPSILHSKVVVIDDMVKLGSSNLDHRSVSRDLEIDVWLDSPQAIKEVEEVMRDNFSKSEWISPDSFQSIGLFRTIRARIILLFKGWL